MDEQVSFGYWLRRRRKALDLTQAELARLVGCAEVTIQKIEADERRPSRQVAELLAEHLNIASHERAAFLQRARGEQGNLPPSASTAVEQAQLPASAAHNLPAQLTSFVGRASELATISSMLAASRLLTLTGPGGTGKTRLALQAAAAVVDRFPQGVWWVELAPLSDSTLITQAIASAAGLREDPSRPLLATLIAFLRDGQAMLVLDNCEHLVDAAAQLVDRLLRACLRLHILATSREPLAIGGEVIFQVPVLSLPAPAVAGQVIGAANSEAVQLFAARARAVQPAFVLTPGNVSLVVQICQRLDGIPLAIELAAARVRVLGLPQIAARLDDRFRLLTSGSRTALPRHQTLQALIDWSYDLLGDDERTLLQQLSVFAGSWTLAAAEAVCAEDPADDVLGLLTRLVDKSLVQAEFVDATLRYRMLDTIRQYALVQLEASGAGETVRRRHAHYYRDFAEQLEEPEGGWPGRIAQFEAEYDNLRAALSWSQVPGGAETGLRLVLQLDSYWTMYGHWSEARDWMIAALAHPESKDHTELRAHVLLNLASTHAYLSEYAAAQAAFIESLSIYEGIGDSYGRAWVLNRLGWLARERGDTSAALPWLQQSIDLFRELGDPYGLLTGLNTIGEVAIMDGDHTLAADLLEEGRALARSFGDYYSEAWSLNHLGHLAQIQGDAERALQLHNESLSLFRRNSEQHLGTAWAFHGLGETALAQNELANAQAWLAEGLAQFRTLGDRAGVSWCLAGLGTLAALEEEPDRAARIWGAAEALRVALGARSAPAAQPTYERALATTRAQLGDQAFEAAWDAGQALPLETAIAEALA